MNNNNFQNPQGGGFPRPPEGPVSFNHPIYDQDGEGQDGNAPNFQPPPFNPQGNQNPNPQGNSQRNPQSSNEYENGNDYDEGYGEQEGYEQGYGGGGSALLATGLKLAGILMIALILFIGFQWVKGRKDKNFNEVEQIIKMYPTGGVRDESNKIKGYTPKTGNEQGQSTNESDLVDETLTGVITEIMKYTKGVAIDGRTLVSLESETYGYYEIYVPHSRYITLDEKGFLLVDVELVNDEVKFLYISNKQDNLNQLLNNR